MAEVGASTAEYLAAFDRMFPDGAATAPGAVNLAAAAGTAEAARRMAAAVEAFHAVIALPPD